MTLTLDLVEVVRVELDDGTVHFVEPDELTDFLKQELSVLIPTTPGPAPAITEMTSTPKRAPQKAYPSGRALPIEGGFLRECRVCGEPMPSERQKGQRPVHPACAGRAPQPGCRDGGDSHFWQLAAIDESGHVAGTCKYCQAGKTFPAHMGEEIREPMSLVAGAEV